MSSASHSNRSSGLVSSRLASHRIASTRITSHRPAASRNICLCIALHRLSKVAPSCCRPVHLLVLAAGELRFAACLCLSLPVSVGHVDFQLHALRPVQNQNQNQNQHQHQHQHQRSSSLLLLRRRDSSSSSLATGFSSARPSPVQLSSAQLSPRQGFHFAAE